MATDIHQLCEWPNFTWDCSAVAEPLAEWGLSVSRFAQKLCSARWHGKFSNFSEIEGKKLDTDQVRSSIARRLCPYIVALTPLIGIFSAAITRLRW